jgi:hypothetical protein
MKRIDDLNDGEITSVKQVPDHLAVCGTRKAGLAWHLGVSGQELLHDLPPLIEGLHESAVVGEGTHDKVASVVKERGFYVALRGGDDTNPEATRRL